MGRRLLQVGTGILLGLITVAVALRATLGAGPAARATDDPHVLQVPYPAGSLGLPSHEGARVELEDLPWRYTVVFFGYTHCPDVCPLTLANLTRAVESLGDAGEDVGAVLVTVDPARDTQERLARYMASFHPSFLGLTGTQEEIGRVTGEWGIFHQIPDEGRTAEGYLVDHSARAFVVDRDGRVVASFPPQTGPDAMATTLGRLLGRR